MKIALVCDDLVQYGGHEKVILDICRIFPEAPLYTTFATKKWLEICRQENIDLKTTWMQKLPLKEKLSRVYAPFLLYILALEGLDLDEYDLVISISSRFAHGIVTKPKTKHICYMSTVGRMFWEPESYFANYDLGLPNFFKRLMKLFLALPLSYIRCWDKTASTRPDIIYVNSETTRKRVKKYYGRDSEIIYPAVNLEDFFIDKADSPYDHYLILGRLISHKRFDLAVKACLELGENLWVIGDGPDKNRLKKLSGGDKRIKFLGYVSGEEKIKYLQSCKALIHPQYEDFGLVPLEAMACGRPVIAYGKGGALETVESGVSGEFFETQNVKSLIEILKKFDPGKYPPVECRKSTGKFALQIFNKNIKEMVASKK